MPWLGQPCRFVGPWLNPSTSTRCSIFPVLLFQGGQIDELAVWGNGQAIAAAFITLFPQQFFRKKIKTEQGARRRHVKAVCLRTSGDAFYVQWPMLFVHTRGGNSLDE